MIVWLVSLPVESSRLLSKEKHGGADLEKMLETIWRFSLELEPGRLHNLILSAAVRTINKNANVPVTHPTQSIGALLKPLAKIADQFCTLELFKLQEGLDTAYWNV